MVSFKDYIENEKGKNQTQLTTSMVQYPSGFMYLDYAGGSYLTVYDEKETPLYRYHNIGITGGSVCSVIAKSQTGKSSLSVSMAASIIEPYINRVLYEAMMRDIISIGKLKKTPDLGAAPIIEIMDTERTFSVDYAKKITRYTNPMAKKHIVITHVTTDMDVIRALNTHINYKIKHMQKIPAPMTDMFGDMIYDYPPTVIIIDSMSQLLMENCDDPSTDKKSKNGLEDIYTNATNNMAGARRAKIISALVSQLVNYAKRYNIIIFSINHINKVPPTNGIPTKMVHFLRANESISGGERAMYLTANILRLNFMKAIGNTKSTMLDLGPDTTGFVTFASWVKCKSNSKSNSCQLVYTDKNTYDPFLSTIYNAKEMGHIVKSGMKYVIPGHEDLKFTLKDCDKVFGDNPEMFTYLYDHLRRKCEPMLDDPDAASNSNRKQLEQIRDDIHEDYNNGMMSRGDMFDMDDMFSSALND